MWGACGSEGVVEGGVVVYDVRENVEMCTILSVDSVICVEEGSE